MAKLGQKQRAPWIEFFYDWDDTGAICRTEIERRPEDFSAEGRLKNPFYHQLCRGDYLTFGASCSDWSSHNCIVHILHLLSMRWSRGEVLLRFADRVLDFVESEDIPDVAVSFVVAVTNVEYFHRQTLDKSSHRLEDQIEALFARAKNVGFDYLNQNHYSQARP